MFRYLSLIACSSLALGIVADAWPGQPAARTDAFGDPLPPGAIARLGTIRFRHDATIDFGAFLPDGKSVISASRDSDIRVWEFPSGKQLRRFSGTPRPATSLNAAALSADGKLLASSFREAAGEQEIRVHDIATGKEMACLLPPSTVVYNLSFSADGKQLRWWESSVGRIWDWAGGKELGKYLVKDSYSTRNDNECLAYSTDGKTLLAYGLSNCLAFVDIPSGASIPANAGHLAPIMSTWITRDGKHVFTRDDDYVHQWELAAGKNIGPVKLAAVPGRRMIVSPTGRIGIVSISVGIADWIDLGGGGFLEFPPVKGSIATGGVVGPEVVLFDLASGKAAGKITLDSAKSIGPALFSPDSKLLAIQSTVEEVNLYDVATAKHVRTLKLPGEAAGSSTAAAYVGIPNMIFSADGKMLAYQQNVNSTTIILFDVATGKQAGELRWKTDNIALPVNPPPAAAKGGKVKGVATKKAALYGAFSTDGRCLAVVRDYVVTLVELSTLQTRATFGEKPPPDARITPVGEGERGPLSAFSPDGQLLARPRYDGTVLLFDILTGKELAAFKGHMAFATGVAFAPDGKSLVSVSIDSTALIWDIAKVPRAAPHVANLNPGDLEKRWQALAHDDAAAAYAALRDLIATPTETVALLKDRINPAKPLESKVMKELIGQLDHGQYKVREKATADLIKIGELIVPTVEQALAGNPSPEARSRLEELHGKLTGMILRGDRLRAYRAIEVLELIGTPDAKKVLQSLAGGAPEALITRSATEALIRLGGQQG